MESIYKMNLVENKKHLDKYASYMEEVKKRTGIARKIVELKINGEKFTGDDDSDIDIVYLQLRKVTELIMFACVVTRKAAGDQLNKILRKGYDPVKLKIELDKLNVDYFPRPKYEKGVHSREVRSVGNLSEKGVPFASIEDLLSAYGRAGNYLHAQRENKYGTGRAKIKVMERAVEDFNNITTLLNHHWIKINEEAYFAVVMDSIGTGKVNVSLMQKVNV